MISSQDKIDCGYYGIRKEQCLANDCCWQPTNEDGIPWCYHETRNMTPYIIHLVYAQHRVCISRINLFTNCKNLLL